MRCTERLEMQITPAITFVFLCHVFIEKNSLILLIIAWPFAVLVNGILKTNIVIPSLPQCFSLRFTAVSSAFYKSERFNLHFGRVDKLVVRSNTIHYFLAFYSSDSENC